MSISEQDAVAPLTPERDTAARADEWLSDTYRSAPGAACHALRVRLAGGPSAHGPDALAGRFAALAAELPAGGGRAETFRACARLWTERVPGPADAPAAERRRDRELARPVDAPVRAVLLRYADGAADLVVVAHRAALGAEALRRFTARLLGGAGEPPAPAAGRPGDPARQAAELAECALGAQLDWGLGRPHGPGTPETRTLPLPADHPAGDAESWTAALGVVLARYEGVSRPVLATTAPDAHAMADRIALVPVTADGAHPLGTVDKELRTALAAGPAHFTGELRRALTAAGTDPSGAAA
ncbi:hypothetical protein QC282_30540, partial [Streptomyces sp. DH24]|nr:hypothetical protein [Streptomyces sp. DH24]